MILGITGGIGTGKSRCLAYLKEKYGCEIIEADALGRQVSKKGTACYDGLRALLGEEFFSEDGELNREKVGGLAFSRPEILKKMNEIIHPAVFAEIEERIKGVGEKKLIVVECAILFQVGLNAICDQVWYIYSNRAVRYQRLREGRGMDSKRISMICDSQEEEEDYRAASDLTIDNSLDFERTKKALDKGIRGIINENMYNRQ